MMTPQLPIVTVATRFGSIIEYGPVFHEYGTSWCIPGELYVRKKVHLYDSDVPSICVTLCRADSMTAGSAKFVNNPMMYLGASIRRAIESDGTTIHSTTHYIFLTMVDDALDFVALPETEYLQRVSSL